MVFTCFDSCVRGHGTLLWIVSDLATIKMTWLTLTDWRLPKYGTICQKFPEMKAYPDEELSLLEDVHRSCCFF